MHEGIITKLVNLREIKGADRIVAADVSNGVPIASVVVSKDHFEGEIGIYFPPDLQLSEEYCHANDLIARFDESGKKIGGGYFNHKRRVTAQRFKGVRSDGIWMPLNSLAYIDDPKINSFEVGQVISYWQRSDGENFPLCQKYFSEKTAIIRQQAQRKIEPLADFPKHRDTEQLIHVIGEIPAGAKIIISEKLHGTSHRVGNVEVYHKRTWLQKAINHFAKVFGKAPYPETTYAVVHGTRNTIVSREKEGFHGKEDFRFDAVGEVTFPKNTIVYGEIVGYANGKPIMPPHNAKDFKDIAKMCGQEFVYSYGVEPDHATFIAYRVTQKTNGVWRDLNWDEFVTFCKQYRIKHIHAIEAFVYDGNQELLFEVVKNCAEENKGWTLSQYANHPSEGVVLWVETTSGVIRYKYKSFAFKVMEGIIKDIEVDPEEIA
jgi:hypothetical protein